MLRVDEIYVSTQGEGPRVGTPTIFVRFGGCNLRCPGWPCDTQHAIDPQFRKEWELQSPDEVLRRVKELHEQTGAILVCLTGGEPFLQKNEDLKELCFKLEEELFAIECFSNGTIVYPPWAFDKIMFIMDWKLTGSGEGDRFLDNRKSNLIRMATAYRPDVRQAVKFVVKDLTDFREAERVWRYYLSQTDIQVFVGRVWDSPYTDANVVQWVLDTKLPWRLNVQVHNYIWDRDMRGK